MSFTNIVKLHEPANDTLWNDLRSGNKSSLEVIYRQYIKDLFNFGMSLHADETIVKDAIQDVFIDLWNYRAKLCTDVVIKQYLFKSLSNRIQKELGKNSRRSSIHRLMDHESIVNSIEEDLIHKQTESEIVSKMYSSLEKLPIRQKEVLHYLFFQKLSYEETAKLLEINIRSTYTLAWKAINSLKKAVTVLTVLFFHV